MFRLSLAHPQEAIHEHGFGGRSVVTITITGEQSASITASYTHQNCVRAVPPDDGQVMAETCRDFEF
jgi:hypothetical protein